MIRDELRHRLDAEPFEPFAIRLVNGERHNVFDPQSISLQSGTVMILPQDQSWLVFPLDKILSLESLLFDFQGGPPTATSE